MKRAEPGRPAQAPPHSPLRVGEMNRLLNIRAGDIAEPRRWVMELLKQQLPGCRDAVLAHDEVDLCTVRIQQPRSERRLRGLADPQMAGETALGADDMTGDALQRSLYRRDSEIAAVSSQPPAPQALGLLKISAQIVTAWPAGSCDVCNETLMPFEVRTSVDDAPGTKSMNVWPGPIEKTGLVPISEPPAAAGAAAARTIPMISKASRDLIRASFSTPAHGEVVRL